MEQFSQKKRGPTIIVTLWSVSLNLGSTNGHSLSSSTMIELAEFLQGGVVIILLCMSL